MTLRKYVRSPREVLFRLRQEAANLRLLLAAPRCDSPVYFRRIPYLDFEKVGDHKAIWEPNRHQHLVTLAQAGDANEIERQIRAWLEKNPFQRGINWCSALEVAFRALSWIRVWQLVGAKFDAPFRRIFLDALYRHGRHIEANLSIYFSPNTHLLGEAVALHALGTLFPQFPRAKKWREKGARIVRRELDHQVLPDGVHFEISSWYHVYALDFFLIHYLLAGKPKDFEAPLQRMTEWLDTLLGDAGTIPLIGDDDGGRVLPFDRPAWAPKPRVSRLAAGFCVMEAGPVQAILNAAPFGKECTGHRHADLLSLSVREGAEDVLFDPGTFTYVADPALRNWFRGTSAHNTVRIDGQDQALPAGPFSWDSAPRAGISEWREGGYVDAFCAYRGFRHRRRVFFLKPYALLILDEVTGPEGDHTIEQFWHHGRRKPLVAGADEVHAESAWRSRAFGTREPAPVLRAVRRGKLPLYLAAVIVFDVGQTPTSAGRPPGRPSLQLDESPEAVSLVLTGPRTVTAIFHPAGAPEIY